MMLTASVVDIACSRAVAKSLTKAGQIKSHQLRPPLLARLEVFSSSNETASPVP